MANCNVFFCLLMHRVDGTSPRQITVYILISLADKYSEISVKFFRLLLSIAFRYLGAQQGISYQNKNRCVCACVCVCVRACVRVRAYVRVFVCKQILHYSLTFSPDFRLLCQKRNRFDPEGAYCSINNFKLGHYPVSTHKKRLQ